MIKKSYLISAVLFLVFFFIGWKVYNIRRPPAPINRVLDSVAMPEPTHNVDSATILIDSDSSMVTTEPIHPILSALWGHLSYGEAYQISIGKDWGYDDVIIKSCDDNGQNCVEIDIH